MSRPEQRPARHPHAGLLASVLTAVVVLDQGSKALIRSHLPVGDRAPLLSGVLEFMHLENRGIAWGLLSGHALRLPLVTLLSLATFVVMLGWYRRLRDDERGLAWSLALVLGGATGNVLDRLLYGRVTDFVELSAPGAIGDAARRLVGGDSWAVFNMADVAITSGILLFAALALSGRAHPPRLGPGTAAPGPADAPDAPERDSLADAPDAPERDSLASPVERPR